VNPEKCHISVELACQVTVAVLLFSTSRALSFPQVVRQQTVEACANLVHWVVRARFPPIVFTVSALLEFAQARPSLARAILLALAMAPVSTWMQTKIYSALRNAASTIQHAFQLVCVSRDTTVMIAHKIKQILTMRKI